MKRDFELIRKLLLEVEGETVNFGSFTHDQMFYHKALLIESGLADGPSPDYDSGGGSEIPDRVVIRKLTSEGHDFVDAVRDEGRWMKIKEWIRTSGKIMTPETLKHAIDGIFISG